MVLSSAGDAGKVAACKGIVVASARGLHRIEKLRFCVWAFFDIVLVRKWLAHTLTAFVANSYPRQYHGRIVGLPPSKTSYFIVRFYRML